MAGRSEVAGLRVAFGAGLVLAALAASSAVAWQFDFAAELGRPLWWRLYDPLAVVRWGLAWGFTEAYRGPFAAGLATAGALVVLPVLALRVLDLYGPLRVGGQDPDAGLGTARDLTRAGQIAARGDGVVVGGAGRRVLRDHGDGHVLVLGTTRSGKTAGHAVPTLLLHTGSMLVFDPKGELAVVTRRRRALLGPVHLIDPTSRDSARLNPLLELRTGDHLRGDCQMAAHMLTHTGAHAPGHDPFWDSAAANVCSALLVHVRTSPDPTLAHLYHLAQDLAAERYPETRDPFVLAVLDAHRAQEAKMRSSVATTLTTRLAFLGDPLVQQATNESDFRPSDLQADERPITVFLQVPVAQAERLRPLTRLLVQSLLLPLMQDLGRTADGRAKRRGLLLLLEEFPQLGRLDVVENGLAVSAGYGVRAMLLCQDEDQIARHYGERQTITSLCSTVCAMAGYSKGSLQTIARWGGEHTVAHGSKQRPAGVGGTASESQSETRAAVLNVRELLRRSRAEVLVLTIGAPPTWLRKVRYFTDPTFRGLYDPPTAAAPEPATRTAGGTTTEEEDPWLTMATTRWN